MNCIESQVGRKNGNVHKKQGRLVILHVEVEKNIFPFWEVKASFICLSKQVPTERWMNRKLEEYSCPPSHILKMGGEWHAVLLRPANAAAHIG